MNEEINHRKDWQVEESRKEGMNQRNTHLRVSKAVSNITTPTLLWKFGLVVRNPVSLDGMRRQPASGSWGREMGARGKIRESIEIVPGVWSAVIFLADVEEKALSFFLFELLFGSSWRKGIVLWWNTLFSQLSFRDAFAVGIKSFSSQTRR